MSDTTQETNVSNSADQAPVAAQPSRGQNARVAVMALGIAVGMLGMSYAAVPLYEIFCRVTGFGGTTQTASEAPTQVLDRKITVRFNANISRELGWSFKPVQNTMEVKIGESVLAFYRATNESSETLTGTASFNVVPEIAGLYFSKIECFCFQEQTLKPGQSVDMPVTFFVDPEMVKDRDSRNLQEITLSYTFHRTEKTAEAAAAPRPQQAAKQASTEGSDYAGKQRL